MVCITLDYNVIASCRCRRKSLIIFEQNMKISASVGSEKQLAASVENGRGKFIMVVEVDIAE